MGCGSSKGPLPNKDTCKLQDYYEITEDDLNLRYLQQPMKAHCLELREKGHRQYVQVFSPKDLKATLGKLDEMSPIYTSMIQVPNGMICTWLNSERGFFACEAKSIIELGSTHMNILIRTGHKVGDKVYSAGECIKTFRDVIEFNVHSGSIASFITNEQLLVKNAKEAFSKFNMDWVHVPHLIQSPGRPSRFITMIRGWPSYNLLRDYKRIGYNVRVFNNKSNCDQLKKYLSINEAKNNASLGERDRLIGEFTKADLVGGKSRRYRKNRKNLTRRKPRV